MVMLYRESPGRNELHHNSLSFASIMGMLRDEKVAITRERGAKKKDKKQVQEKSTTLESKNQSQQKFMGAKLEV